MLGDLWPTYQLRISTPRLQLRLPDEGERAELAVLAGRGVHPPSERPFLTPWTDGTAQGQAQIVLQSHWGDLAEWSVDSWNLGLGVFAGDGEPLGMVTVRARDFAVVREVATSSWLGLAHHRKGFGTEARLGLLTLAFDHLGAEAAVSEVFQDNHASQGVSRKLGYQPDGISRHDTSRSSRSPGAVSAAPAVELQSDLDPLLAGMREHGIEFVAPLPGASH